MMKRLENTEEQSVQRGHLEELVVHLERRHDEAVEENQRLASELSAIAEIADTTAAVLGDGMAGDGRGSGGGGGFGDEMSGMTTPAWRSSAQAHAHTPTSALSHGGGGFASPGFSVGGHDDVRDADADDHGSRTRRIDTRFDSGGAGAGGGGGGGGIGGGVGGGGTSRGGASSRRFPGSPTASGMARAGVMSLARQVNHLSSALQSARDKLSATQAQYDGEATTAREASTTSAKLVDEIQKLESQQREMEAELKASGTAVSSLTARLEKATTDNDAVHAEVRHLTTSLDAARSAAAEASQRHDAAAAALRTERDALGRKAEGMARELETASSAAIDAAASLRARETEHAEVMHIIASHSVTTQAAQAVLTAPQPMSLGARHTAGGDGGGVPGGEDLTRSVMALGAETAQLRSHLGDLRADKTRLEGEIEMQQVRQGKGI